VFGRDICFTLDRYSLRFSAQRMQVLTPSKSRADPRDQFIDKAGASVTNSNSNFNLLYDYSQDDS
jgi:hypothetical protein